jgi:pSer/pThr/pTyr-binding forkhead associated (FHA) protein
MEPNATPPPLPGDAPPAVLGELVVGNGRLIATRRALTGPLTLIGDGSGCDVRLHSDKIAPFHCALFHGPDGFVLRDLGAAGGTLVNGKAVESCPLRHGDRIEVGPFHLVLEMPDGGQEAEAPTEPALEEERDALRIQAAAVVAQQAALTEEELRLQQRRDGLERQEEQLANHLEEKRRNLVEMREQLKTEREAFKEERSDDEQRLAERHSEAEKTFAEADEERREAQKERARFVELRKRLKRRWEAHFAAHEADLLRREKERAAGAERLAAEAAALERERGALAEQRLKHNGDMELGRRQLAEAWEELAVSQQEWEACLNQERTDYNRRTRELLEREERVALREQEAEDERRNWEEVRAEREQESEGLEVRIRNQRLKLQSLEQSAANLDAARKRQTGAAAPGAAFSLPPAPAPEVPPAAIECPEAPAVLTRLAGCLADQRLHLLEQWRGVLEVQDHWQQQRESLLSELEDSGRRLAERERLLGEREQRLEALAAALEQRQEALAQLRCSLEGRQARLTAAGLEWEAERARVLDEARTCEETAAVRVKQLRRLYRRSFARHRAQVNLLEEARRHCEEVRQQYAGLWEECRVRTEGLIREQQSLAGETLAVERLRLEILGKSENAAAAEKRLEKLRRQSQVLVERAERELQRERLALRAEYARLEQRGQVMRQDEEVVIAWRRKLANRQRKQDAGAAAAQEAEAQRSQEMELLLARHEQDAKQLRELRDEVERVARLMMEESGNAPSSPLAA